MQKKQHNANKQWLAHASHRFSAISVHVAYITMYLIKDQTYC